MQSQNLERAHPGEGGPEKIRRTLSQTVPTYHFGVMGRIMRGEFRRGFQRVSEGKWAQETGWAQPALSVIFREKTGEGFLSFRNSPEAYRISSYDVIRCVVLTDTPP